MQSQIGIKPETGSFSGIGFRIDVPGTETGGRLTVIEMNVKPGAGAPLHISFEEDKYFCILVGRLRFAAGDQERELTAGATVTVARGTPHGFHNPGAEVAQLILVSTPAGHDAFFRDMAALPVPHQLPDVAAVCTKHKQQIVDLTLG
ncbi:MAG: cupin domain-containing protein [Bryobacteraceae bacterium]|nr:cupin domain-containing protein [Bryobacteraceae bacterium]